MLGAVKEEEYAAALGEAASEASTSARALAAVRAELAEAVAAKEAAHAEALATFGRYAPPSAPVMDRLRFFYAYFNIDAPPPMDRDVVAKYEADDSGLNEAMRRKYGLDLPSMYADGSAGAVPPPASASESPQARRGVQQSAAAARQPAKADGPAAVEPQDQPAQQTGPSDGVDRLLTSARSLFAFGGDGDGDHKKETQKKAEFHLFDGLGFGNNSPKTPPHTQPQTPAHTPRSAPSPLASAAPVTPAGMPPPSPGTPGGPPPLSPGGSRSRWRVAGKTVMAAQSMKQAGLLRAAFANTQAEQQAQFAGLQQV